MKINCTKAFVTAKNSHLNILFQNECLLWAFTIFVVLLFDFFDFNNKALDSLRLLIVLLELKKIHYFFVLLQKIYKTHLCYQLIIYQFSLAKEFYLTK